MQKIKENSRKLHHPENQIMKEKSEKIKYAVAVRKLKIQWIIATIRRDFQPPIPYMKCFKGKNEKNKSYQN